jgi:nitrogen fixation protein NifT
MANIMIQRTPGGGLFYLPKRDLEASIESIEFDTAEKWGGELKLDNGGIYYIDPIAKPHAARSLRARRLAQRGHKENSSWQ